MKQISVALIGAGDRGTTYSRIMHDNSEKFKIVAVAEPITARRESIKNLWNIPESECYESWKELLNKPRLADMVIVSVLDQLHKEAAFAAIEKGYQLLLEKPVAQTPEECADIARAAREKGVHVLVCHVLRYNHYFRTVKKLLMEGVVGDIVSIEHVEAVGNRHQSHSYVRGNWHSEKETTPMLLAKSCHDIDMIQWLMGKACKKVQSFGSLTYFTAKNAPAGAPERCIDGCPIEKECPYSALKLYYEDKDNLWFRTACTKGIAKSDVPTDEEVMEALKTTDFGRCVFRCDNDVVDHQTVNMEFEDGATASFSMNAFNAGGRYIRIFGTKGELYKNMEEDSVTVYTFRDKKKTVYHFTELNQDITGGHGGGDERIIAELYDFLCGTYTGVSAAEIDISVKNHLIAFAAEESRHAGTVVDVDEYFARYGFVND